MKKIYTLIVLCLLAVTATTQKPTATFYNVPAGMAPTIDGVADDDLWELVDPISCGSNFIGEMPTCTASWQAAWDCKYIYIFISIMDDYFCPPTCSGRAGWQSDKPEIYFDVNATLVDGGGPSVTPGHYMVSMEIPTPNDTSGTFTSYGTNYGNIAITFDFASHIDGNNQYWEFAIDQSTILDENDVSVNPYNEIGFDVNIVDTDSANDGRRRLVWANTGNVAESWGNMDDCGIVTFDHPEYCSSPPPPPPEKPTATIYKVSSAPAIDGVADDAIWGLITPVICEHHFPAETPTCTLSWQAAWDDDNIYIFVTVLDDVFAPPAITGVASWQSDKVEIYFDVNADLLVKTASGGAMDEPGHYQVNMEIPPPNDTAGTYTGTSGNLYGNTCLTFDFASHIDGADEYWEYAVSLASIKDKNGVAVNPFAEPTIGFEVDFIDADTNAAGEWLLHRRKAWGYADGWGNMDTCGHVTFASECCPPPPPSKPTATIHKVPAGFEPTIDGVADDFLWNLVDPVICEHHFPYETPTCTLSWQAVWDEDNIYIFVTVLDDVFAPPAITHIPNFLFSDNVYINFDVNSLLEDGGGAEDDPGHYEVNMEMTPRYDTSGTFTAESGAPLYGNQSLTYDFAFNIDGADEYWEYAIHVNTIKDKDGVAVKPCARPTIGFDVVFYDADTNAAGEWSAHNRKAWGYVDGWNNMDTCGHVTFQGGGCDVGIDDVEVNSFSIYPNPATNAITINMDFDAVEISSVLGQTVSSIKNSKGNSIDIDLESGLYFITVYNKGNIIGTRRLIIK